MIEQIDDMPPGTLGLRASGTLTKDDYVGVLEPALDTAIASGSLRLLFVLEDFDGLAPGAWAEDAKVATKALIRDHAAWTRFALVTDVTWVARATRAFTWMIPGASKVFALAELDAARTWVATD